MAVEYKLVERINPLRREEPKKFYAQVKSTGEITLKKLGKEIALGSMVSDTDVLAVLNDLTKALARHLSEGHIVRLGDFGSFQISLSSKGVESPEKFNASVMKNPKIIFRPGVDLREMLATLKYEKGE